MQVTRKIISINEELCNGCGQCIVDCAESALEIIDGKAKLVADKYCDGLGACMGNCPTGALRIIERVADDFDEAAVEALLQAKKKEEAAKPAATMACGCASSHIQTFTPLTPCQSANQPTGNAGLGPASALSHWPIQIRLVPPSAPFLKGAELLVAADCTAYAYANFHRDFLANKVVMVGCPKFDDGDSYVQKFAEIFATAQLKSVTLVIMEVPCCSNMRAIIKAALKQSGVTLAVNETVVSTRGEIIRQGAMN